ncbi:MAG: hypothetical protein NC324_09140 [Bacteroides sp.]|nr:hypothetical protein [Bacteroides sp.]
MIKKRNLLMIWVKRVFFALALAGTAGVMLPSCEKEPTEREPYTKDLFFTKGYYDSIEPAVLKHFARDNACTNIYMHVMDDNNFTSITPSKMRNYLQERINVSSKISGRGDFRFKVGETSQADSLWFVQNGWTVNKRYWDRYQH